MVVGGGGHGDNGAAGGSGYVWWNLTGITGTVNLEATVGGGMEFTTVQCCNEDQKWTEDEESSGSEKRLKTKILQNFEKSSKIEVSSKIFEES